MASTDSSSDGKTPVPSTSFVHSLFASKTDSRIAHLNKILATTSGVDTTLTLVGYSLFFVSSQLSRLENLELQSLAKRFALNASKQLRPGETAVAAIPAPASLVKIADLTVAAKTLAGMCSDVRAFTRLWGLLGVWAAVKRLYLTPPKDNVISALAWGQTSSLGAYLVLENGYYLAGKGVLRGWSAEKQKRWAKHSLKMFLAYLVLDCARLFRTKQLRDQEAENVGAEEKTVEKAAAKQKEEALWWRAAITNAAYTPPAMHWASESGILSDGVFGACMTVVGLLKFQTAWEQTA